MNLFARFMFILLAALRGQSSRDPLEPTRIGLRVWMTDHAFAPTVPLHRIRSYTDLATINSVIRIGLGRLIRRNGWLPIIQAESIRQTGALRFPQKFEVVTSIVGWQDNYVCYVHEVFAGRERVAVSSMLARIIGRKGSAVAISGIAEDLGAPEQSPEITPQFQAMIAESERGRSHSGETNRPA
ncbi:hypothetical protein [Hyphomonas sp.]|uniref:hypothetical protein n=1 Tax=Hyphomonas sp. TaxID=87 RepID=UPI0039E46EAE